MSQKQHTVWLLKKQLHMEQIRTNDVKNISYYRGRKHADYFPLIFRNKPESAS